MGSDHDIFDDGQIVVEFYALERSSDAKLCDARRGPPSDVHAFEQDRPCSGLDAPGNSIEGGRLAGAIWSNQTDYLAFLYGDIQIVQG